MAPMPSAPFTRARMLEQLAEGTFDVLVIGAGITGAGVALDAATRGLRTALVERDDFASGTSSKSSKMVHGGLRYLQQGDVRLVYQALRERQRLFKNAPHLVKVLPFMIPITKGKDGVVSRKIARSLGSAMWLYDATGGWRIGKIHRRVTRDQAIAHLPTLRNDRLAWAYVYYDAAVDDARLVLTVARTAAEHGAIVVNRCGVVELLKDHQGHPRGAVVEADGRRIDVAAKVVVNAAGVWSDEVRALDEAQHPDSIRPAKGVHITIPWEKVRCDIAAIIPVPKDRRSLFIVPWGPKADGTFQHAYVGTTDTDYDGSLDDPQCTKDDVDYVLRALNAALDVTIHGEIIVDDITGVWAGLRPLVNADATGRTADLSRQHHVHDQPGGLITITGGKLTTYREMASDAVDAVVARLGRRDRCRTQRLRLFGAGTFSEPTAGTLAAHLVGRYGSHATDVMALITDDVSLGEPLVPGLAYTRAEALYAVRHEMALSLDDVLTRRTRARLFQRDTTIAVAADVAALLAPALGWDADETDRQVAAFVALCHAEEAAALT
jgi:glycerol-3-phosphate dehydrogenase